MKAPLFRSRNSVPTGDTQSSSPQTGVVDLSPTRLQELGAANLELGEILSNLAPTGEKDMYLKVLTLKPGESLQVPYIDDGWPQKDVHYYYIDKAGRVVHDVMTRRKNDKGDTIKGMYRRAYKGLPDSITGAVIYDEDTFFPTEPDKISLFHADLPPGGHVKKVVEGEPIYLPGLDMRIADAVDEARISDDELSDFGMVMSVGRIEAKSQEHAVLQ